MEENNQRKLDMDKKNKIVSIIGSIVFSIVLVGIGYAYFSATVSNANKETVTVGTATIALEFDDNDNGISGTLNLGQSITKKFTLENTGTVDAYAKINWYNLVNTYMQNSLTWTLEQSTSENGTYTSVGSGRVPTSSTATTAVLKNGLLVPVNTTYYYKLTITLNNLDVNQNSDINASFYSYFSLEEGSLSGADTIQNLVAGEPTNTTDVITKPAPGGATCTNTLAYDGTVDNNLRYVGSNPCNYVTFNGEAPTTGTKWVDTEKSSGTEYDVFDTEGECTTFLQNNGYTDSDECKPKTMTTGGWRIIGVMNNVDDGTGKKETRIKLVRNDALGNYSWDSSKSSVNDGYGVNDWTQADLKNELNGDYLNTNLNANTMWYNGSSDQQSATFDFTKRLSTGAQELIGDAKWYLGGFTYSSSDYSSLIPSTMYTKERETTVWGSTSGQTCNDGACPRATEWTGKVALIYPSDYGYATSGGTTTNRSACIGTISTYYDSSKETWTNSSYSDCKNNDWLKPSSGYNWLLAPLSNDARYAFYVYSTGTVDSSGTGGNYAVLPAVYLQSGVTISGGNGTELEPFLIT